MQSIRRAAIASATILGGLASLPWTAPLPRR